MTKMNECEYPDHFGNHDLIWDSKNKMTICSACKLIRDIRKNDTNNKIFEKFFE